MTKFDLIILSVLVANNADTQARALSVSQIDSLMEETARRSQSTIYRHIKAVHEKGYIEYGFKDDWQSTYYITDSGKAFYKIHN